MNYNGTKMNNQKHRDYTIDVLRVIGTLLVILAHVSPPRMVSEIRTFDVTLLVFISGMSLAYSRYNNYWTYLKKRIHKLCLPTYITVVIVLALLLLGSIVSKSYSISIQYIINSFLLIDNNSIGFVWIVKVYLFIAILAPVIKAIGGMTNNTSVVFIGAYILMIVYSAGIKIIPENIVTHEYLFYALQYSIVAVMGLSYLRASGKQKIAALFISAIVFGIAQMRVGFFSPSDFKYPPQYYYLSYGILVSIILHLLISSIRWNQDHNLLKIMEWMSKNSFTIYIFHIYLMWGYFLVGRVLPNATKGISWLLLYIVVVFGACALCKLFEYLRARLKKGSW